MSNKNYCKYYFREIIITTYKILAGEDTLNEYN